MITDTFSHDTDILKGMGNTSLFKIDESIVYDEPSQ